MNRTFVLAFVVVTVCGLCVPAPAAVIGHWQLNETVNPSGNTTALDSSPNVLNGTYQPIAGPGPVVGVPGATASTGTAADFNGSVDEVILSSPSALKMANDFTITAWINPDTTGSTRRIFSQYPSGGIGYGLGTSGDRLLFTTYGVQDYYTGSLNIPTDTWSHVAVTFDTNNDAAFFVNGQPRQTVPGTAPANIGSNNFFIGSYGTGQWFDGQIDDVQVHSGVLTQSQIQQISGPVRIGYWKLDETVNPSGNTTAVDSSGYGLNGRYQPTAGPGPAVGVPGATAATGTAADFNGGVDEVYLASPGALKMGNNFTIAAWINPDATSGTRRIFSQYSAGNIGYGFGMTGDELRFTTYGIQDYNTGSLNIPTNTWSHVAVTFDENNDATFFVNGHPRQTIAGASPANIGGNNFFIGSTGVSQWFDGQIDDVQVYTGVLDQPQMQQLSGPVLIGHWKLDETVNPSGNTTAVDSSGYGLNGRYQPTAGPGPVVGVPSATAATGTAADFNGGVDEVYLGPPDALKMGNNFTIAAWINPDTTSGTRRIFSQYYAGNIGYGFGMTGDELRFTTYGIQDYDTGSLNIPTDKWTHVAVTFDENNDATFFVNGQPRQTVTGTAPANIGNNNFFIGSTGVSARFDGQIDDVRVYTGQLSRNEILEFTGPILIGHWKLDETANPSGGTVAVDSSGYGLNGTYQPTAGPGPIVGVPAISGNLGTAVNFNGALDEVYLGSPAALKMENNFSIAAWIRPNVTTGTQRIFSQYFGGWIGYGFGLSGDELRFTTYGIQDYNTTGLDIPTGEWTHVAVVFDENNDALFYVNGQFEGKLLGSLGAVIGNNNFFIGSTGVSEWFNGRIDDVRVYAGSLTDEMVQALYDETFIPEPATLTLLGLGALGLLRRSRRRRS